MSDSILDKETFDREIIRCLGDLKNNGYKYQGVSVQRTAALGAYLEAAFVNEATKRVVRVNYLPPLKNYSDALKVFIEDGASKSFAINDCLKLQPTASDVLKNIDINTYAGSFGERVASCLSQVNVLFGDVLKPIIDGKKWVDVPIDWGDYR